MQYWLDVQNNCIHGKVKGFARANETYNTKCGCCGWNYWIDKFQTPLRGVFFCKSCEDPPVFVELGVPLEVST